MYEFDFPWARRARLTETEDSADAVAFGDRRAAVVALQARFGRNIADSEDGAPMSMATRGGKEEEKKKKGKRRKRRSIIARVRAWSGHIAHVPPTTD